MEKEIFDTTELQRSIFATFQLSYSKSFHQYQVCCTHENLPMEMILIQPKPVKTPGNPTYQTPPNDPLEKRKAVYTSVHGLEISIATGVMNPGCCFFNLNCFSRKEHA